MAAIRLQVVPSSKTSFSENILLMSTSTYEKYIVSTNDYTAHHNAKVCFLPRCRCHIIPKGDLKEVLLKFDASCLNYQHVYCLYTFYKYWLWSENIFQSRQHLGDVQSAVHVNQQNWWLERIAKERLLRKKSKSHLLSTLHELKRFKPVDQSLHTELKELKNWLLIRTGKLLE